MPRIEYSDEIRLEPPIEYAGHIDDCIPRQAPPTARGVASELNQRLGNLMNATASQINIPTTSYNRTVEDRKYVIHFIDKSRKIVEGHRIMPMGIWICIIDSQGYTAAQFREALVESITTIKEQAPRRSEF
jgi:hypothetical protein